MTWHDTRLLFDFTASILVCWLVAELITRGVIQLVENMTGSGPMSGKRYGKPQSTRLPEPYPFELMASLDDEDEVHAFTAVRQVDQLLATRFSSFSGEEPHQIVDLLVKLIAKTLDDKDGTPATWSAIQLPSSPDVDGMADYRSVPKFRGPDGELYEMDHVDKFAAFATGSSRRRFLAIVGDQERTVQAEDLKAVVQDLIAVSTGRPTVASSPSSA